MPVCPLCRVDLVPSASTSDDEEDEDIDEDDEEDDDDDDDYYEEEDAEEYEDHPDEDWSLKTIATELQSKGYTIIDLISMLTEIQDKTDPKCTDEYYDNLHTEFSSIMKRSSTEITNRKRELAEMADNDGQVSQPVIFEPKTYHKSI